MNTALPVLLLLVGVALGVAATWLICRVRLEHEGERARASGREDVVRLEGQLAAAHDRIRLLDEAAQAQKQALQEARAAAQVLEDRSREEARLLAAAQAENRQLAELKAALGERETRLTALVNEVTALREQRSTLETSLQQERAKLAEQTALLNEAQQRLTDAFKALASEALSLNNKSFLELAKTQLESFQKDARSDLEKRQQSIAELLKPVRESLEKVDTKIHDLEKARTGAYEALKQQVELLVEGNRQLSTETSKLVGALGTPSVRGRWGEMQLKRVCELAGMLEHCDFATQESVSTEDGRLRPDLVVRLPGGKNIVVDAKAPLEAYLEALETHDDDGYKQKMRDHARQVRAHMNSLCEKRYWSQFEPTPEFVFLFLPGEIFFTAALQHDPALIEHGVEKRVIVATPTTLIALLWAVAYGWQQEAIARNATDISTLGKELYRRIATMGRHLMKLGRNLDNAVEAYNATVASVESNVLTGARRFRDLKAPVEGIEIKELAPIERTARALTKPELLDGVDGALRFDLGLGRDGTA